MVKKLKRVKVKATGEKGSNKFYMMGVYLIELDDHKEQSKPDMISKNRNELIPLCETCDNDAKMRCGGCKSAWYCGTKCQREAWSTHKVSCNLNDNNVKKEGDEDKKDGQTDNNAESKATSNHSVNEDNDKAS